VKVVYSIIVYRLWL